MPDDKDKETAFKANDLNKDGFLDKTELTAYYHSVGPNKDAKITGKDKYKAELMMDFVDFNRDKLVDLEEFINSFRMKYPEEMFDRGGYYPEDTPDEL